MMWRGEVGQGREEILKDNPHHVQKQNTKLNTSHLLSMPELNT